MFVTDKIVGYKPRLVRKWVGSKGGSRLMTKQQGLGRRSPSLGARAIQSFDIFPKKYQNFRVFFFMELVERGPLMTKQEDKGRRSIPSNILFGIVLCVHK